MNNSKSHLPRHVAIIMDGNGRWAKVKKLSRIAGHRAGVAAVRQAVEFCVEKNIEVLSLFAFSSENWRRPPHEVTALMELFARSLKRETANLHARNIKIRFIGNRNTISHNLVTMMRYAEQLTANNKGLCLVIAVNYGGQWDIVNAARQIAVAVQAGKLDPNEINDEIFSQHCVLDDLPQPDLFIRTSGEQRLSNFFLWQLAYTELYFPQVFWPDFGKDEFQKALNYYANRERRFGFTSEQMEQFESA